MTTGALSTCATGCSSEPLCASGYCGAEGTGGDGSSDAGSDAKPTPRGCDTPTEPAKDPEKCLVDEFGVFVSPTGDDGNDGSKAKPFKTIEKALGAMRPRIVVCEGTYAEVLDIQRDAEIYGGVDCSFSREGGKAKLASASSTGLTVSSGTVKLFDVEVAAQAATQPGGSSIGIFAKGGTLDLTRSKVSAGAGAEGVPAAATGDNKPDVDLIGEPAMGAVGAKDKTCTCSLHGSSIGGAGGDRGKAGLKPGGQGTNGLSTPTIPSPAFPYTGEGGAGEAVVGGNCRGGMPGAAASARNGGRGAAKLGVLAISGWQPEGGGPGDHGNPGQGGGGGGGNHFDNGTMAGGGGGGCGGCGGAGASGGGGGGGSFAILAIDARVSLIATSIQTAKGGDGKFGGTGQAGGGGGGGGGGTVGACSGASGGPGAGGGGGGGGAGGVSIGIAYSGEPPTLEGTSRPAADALPNFTLGGAGARGLGGDFGAATGASPSGAPGVKGGDGAPGVAKAIMKVER